MVKNQVETDSMCRRLWFSVNKEKSWFETNVWFVSRNHLRNEWRRNRN